jgi:ElaB/YqjD/DUF883 family membrane-anchored ribosome-binding protein
MAAADDRKGAETDPVGTPAFGSDIKRETAAAANRVGDDLKRAKDNIAQATATARDNAGDDLRRLRDDVASLKDTVAQLAATIGAEIGDSASEIGSDVASSARRQAKTVVEDLEDMTRRNPLGFMAGAFCLGMVIGVMRSR